MDRNDGNSATATNGRIIAFIDGKGEEYNFCSHEELDKAKIEAKKWNSPYYTGSSKIYFVDTVRNESDQICHYFR